MWSFSNNMLDQAASIVPGLTMKNAGVSHDEGAAETSCTLV
jgi:hypothetical protein